MIIVREVFTAKPGQASALAKLFKKAFGQGSKIRIMTDFVGNYNTVVAEMEVESLAEFERQMEAYKSGQPDPKTQEEMSKYTEMYTNRAKGDFQLGGVRRIVPGISMARVTGDEPFHLIDPGLGARCQSAAIDLQLYFFFTSVGLPEVVSRGVRR